MDQGGDEEERWTFVSLGDGTVELRISDNGEDDEHYYDGMAAMMEIYPGWVIVDQGSYRENGEYVTLAMESSE